MSESGTDITVGSETQPAEANRTSFDPSADPDDDLFVVVKTDYLRELTAVYEPTDRNALFLVRENVGIKARSKSEYCYLFEVELPADTFDVFQASDLNLQVDIDALEQAITETRTHRVAIHATADGSVRLRDGHSSTDLSTTEFGPLEDEKFPTGTKDLERNQYNTWDFTVEAAVLEAHLDADTERDHAGIAVDGREGTAEIYFFDTDSDDRTVGLSLELDDFIEPPSPYGPQPDSELAAAPICRESIDHALSPMRDEVTVTVCEYPDILPPHIQYTRADGVLPVYGWIWSHEGALDAHKSVKPER